MATRFNQHSAVDTVRKASWGESLARQKNYADVVPLLQDGYRGMLARKNDIDDPEKYQLKRAHAWLEKVR